MASQTDNPYPRIVNPQPLIDLFSSDDLMRSVWNASDLPAMWAHQLKARLISELRAVDPAWALLVDGFCTRHDPPIQTFGELFACPTPPRLVLDLTKRYAKHHLQTKTQLPIPIAGAVYVLSMLVALAKCGESVTSHSEDQVLAQAQELSRQEWIDERTRSWLEG